MRGCTGFEWDDGNSEKNWIRHRVSRGEAEQVFFHQPLVVADDDRVGVLVPAYDEGAVADIKKWFEAYYTIQFANYPVDDRYMDHGGLAVPCAPPR